MPRILPIVAALLLALAAAAQAAPATAYTTNNCRKHSADLGYRIEAYGAASAEALADWDATPTRLDLSPAPGYDLRIGLGNHGKSGYDAITLTWCGSGVQTYPSQTYFNEYYTRGYTRLERRQLAVHEIGHALGLGHAGTARCAGQPIMYANADRFEVCGHVRPQPDDIAGINALYR